MGWETIKGRRYFYETTYVEGKRIRRCWGRGPEAVAAAARVEQKRQSRLADLAQVQAFRDRDRQIDKQVEEFIATVTHTIQTHLHQAGYHYCRNQWRKRIVQMNHQTSLNNLTVERQKVRPTKQSSTKNPQYFGDDIRRAALVVLATSREHLANRDESLRGLSTPEDKPKVDVDRTIAEVEAKVTELRQEFQYDESNTFNRLVIEQLLTAWVQWYVAGWLLEAELPTDRSQGQNQYFSQRYQQCQTRLTKAIDQLAKIRQIPVGRLKLETQAERDARAQRQLERDAIWKMKYQRANS